MTNPTTRRLPEGLDLADDVNGLRASDDVLVLTSLAWTVE